MKRVLESELNDVRRMRSAQERDQYCGVEECDFEASRGDHV